MKKSKPLTLFVAPIFVVALLILAACTPDAAPAAATPEPSPTAMPEPTNTPEPEPTDTPEPEPTDTPEPTAEPTPTEAPEGPPPTDADLSLYTEEEDREAYQVIVLDTSALQPFHDAYEAALEENADWLQDPYAVADLFMETTRRFAEEPIPYEESFYLPAPPDEAIIIFIQGEFRDDSVWGSKIRIELVLQDDVWEIVWAGEQWRCRRGDADLIENWHTTLCP
jgi:hypothetical protein